MSPNESLAICLDRLEKEIGISGSLRCCVRDIIVESFSPCISHLKKQVQSNWELAETIACGETITCVTCGKPKPCICDK